MLLLEPNGSINQSADSEVSEFTRIEGSAAIDSLATELLSATGIIVNFASSADGRGFSLPAWFRQQHYTGTIIVAGNINPDQVSAAFQCGFDGVLITPEQSQRYDREVWEAALTPIVNVGYAPFDSSAVSSIWLARAQEISQPLHQ